MLGDFRAVAAAELVPAFGIMIEPSAQLGAGCDVLDPFGELGFDLADAPRPQAIYEDSRAVVFSGWFISSLDANLCGRNGTVLVSGDLR